MTLGARITWDDSVLPFQLDRSDIRGRVARLGGVLDGVLSQHDYPPAIEALVAETALLTALIGQTVKLRWKLSIQVRGDGPVRLIATDYYAPEREGEPARIRAYAGHDAERLTDGAPFEQIGRGYFAILIDQGEGTTPIRASPRSRAAASRPAPRPTSPSPSSFPRASRWPSAAPPSRGRHASLARGRGDAPAHA